jgi:hypothetical protein
MNVDVSFATVGDTICVSRTPYVRSRRPSYSRGTGQPGSGIMPHGGKSCQGQTAFRPALETPATRRRGRMLKRRPDQAGPRSCPSGSLRENIVRRGQGA